MISDKQKQRIKMLRSQGYGYRKVADKLGLNLNSVKSYCQRDGLGGVAKPVKTPVVYTEDISFCPNCGEEIRQIAKQTRKRSCCDKCRNEWRNSHTELIKRKAYYEHTCQSCGKTFTSYGDRNRKYCCHECYVKERFGSKQVE